MKRVLALLVVVLPGRFQPWFARRLLGWDIDRSARIGLSLVFADHVSMGPGASIGRWNTITHLDELRLGKGASIGSRNSIRGWPVAVSDPFPSSPNRRGALVLGDYAIVTATHEIDCCDRVELGHHAFVGGFGCQILTHSLDIVRNRFVTGPIEIGDYGGILTACIMLSGTRVPARSIVSASSVVSTKLKRELTFYRGNPAEPVRDLPETLGCFTREGLPGVEFDEAGWHWR